MDSKTPPPTPPPSSFVPLSLADTLTRPTRTLHSSRSSRPSHAHHPSLVVTSKEKAEIARREAQAMCVTLGIGTELGAGAAGLMSMEAETPRPGRTLKDTKQQEDEKELVQLRRTVSEQKSEILALRKKVTLLEKEKDKAAKASSLSLGGESLGARDLEALEKSFADQEFLLAGYQRDSERVHVAMEALRVKNRKAIELLQKVFGPGWDEAELDHVPGSSSSLQTSSGTTSFDSPALLQKLATRSTSINKNLATPTGLIRTTKESSSSINTVDDSGMESSSSEFEILSSNPAQVESPSPSPTQRFLSPAPGQQPINFGSMTMSKEAVTSVQLLLRSMERQMIAREMELEALEKRAKGEMDKALRKERECAELAS